jgi:hypothetical protein
MNDFSECVQYKIFYKKFTKDFQGYEISWRTNVFTGQMDIEINDEFAFFFGFQSLEKMMMNNEILDFANSITQQLGEFPFQQTSGTTEMGVKGCCQGSYQSSNPPF